MTERDLFEYADLAHNILNSETQYQSNKEIISELFAEKTSDDFESVVKNRITIIDSYYSTQMSKRLYGIDELSRTLAKYTDEELKSDVIKFLSNPKSDGKINSILSKEYGIDKTGKPFGKAASLISKYIYFLNTYDFPIYDRLALISYDLLQKSNIISQSKKINEYNFFEFINQLNVGSGINNYEKLDNLLWLIGKISKGSFAILMDLNKYLELIDSKEIKSEFQKNINMKSSAKDDIIRNYIKNNYNSSPLFTDDQKTFFEFVFSLKF